MDLEEVARDVVVAFVSAYGATPQSVFTYSPDIPLDVEDDDDEVPARSWQVHEGTGPLERAARTAPLPAYLWLEDDAVVAAASQNPLYVTWAVSADHRSTIGAMIERATRQATDMRESTLDTWIDTAEFRAAQETADVPPTLRTPAGLIAALPADLQADRLALLVVMFGSRAATPIVMTGRDEFSLLDNDDQVDDACQVVAVRWLSSRVARSVGESVDAEQQQASRRAEGAPATAWWWLGIRSARDVNGARGASLARPGSIRGCRWAQ